MIKLQRDPEKFEVLELFSAMGTQNGYKINDVSSVEDFINRVSESIKESAQNDRTKYGKRIESLFAYVVGALGQVKLLKQEDSGNIYYLGDEITAPDYKAVLNDNTQVLIEVKNFYSNDIEKEFKIEKDYYKKLKKYSEIVNIPIKFAIYFTKMNQWFLLSIEAFDEQKNSYAINFVNAYKNSEMAMLGDKMIGTTPDLEFQLLTNPKEAKTVESTGLVDFTIREVKFFCAGTEITDKIEQNLIFNFIQYGKWVKQSEAIMDENKLLGTKMIYSPEEKSQEQPFEIIGTLSSIISTKFKEITSNNGEVESLDLGLNPSNFEIFIPADYNSKTLPLWQFIIRPE